MNINDFLEFRRKEKEWLNLNGYENGDSKTNGEYAICNALNNEFNVFVDVGANKGDFSNEVKKINNNIELFCFEPNPNHIKELKKITYENNVFNKALSNKIFKTYLNVNNNDTTTSSIYERTEMMPNFVKKMNKIEVDVDILDNYYDLISKNVEKGLFIKIDVEGSELMVMEGAQKLLNIDHPIFILFEYSFGWKESNRNFKEAFHFLDKNGFKLYRLLPFGIEKIKFYINDMDNYMYCNYFAIKNKNCEDILSKNYDICNKTGMSKIYLYKDSDNCEE